MNKHKEKINQIKNELEKAGFNCKEQVPVIRKDNQITKNRLGYIDLCCEKLKRLLCFEVENCQGQVQALENSRDLNRMEKIAREKGITYRKCHIKSNENWRGNCK